MKKLIALILSLLLLTGCTAAYDGPTESVWVVTEQSTTFYSTRFPELESARTIYSYDSRGNQVLSQSYTNDQLDWVYKSRYDDRGNLISRTAWYHAGLIPYPLSRTRYTYDAQNRPLTTIYRNFFFVKTGSDIYTYDDELHTVHWDGTHDTQTKYLDEKGNILRTVTFSEPAGMEIETVYEYDALGRNIKISNYYDGVLSTTTELRYDEDGRLLESAIWGDGQLLRRDTHRYEENTVITRDLDNYKTIEYLRPDGQVERQEQYDAAGNLTSRSDYFYTEIQIPAKEE